MTLILFLNVILFHFSAGRPLPPTSETPVTSPRHSILHSESMNRSSVERNISNTTNDLNKQNPARPYYGDPRNPGKFRN